MEKILLYTGNIEKKKQIEKVSRLLGMRLQEIGVKELPCTIGAIAGISRETKKSITVPVFYQMPEVMIFSGISEERMDLFLKSYRMAGIEPIALKAMVTMYNCSWTLMQLIEELKEEHQRMG